MKRLTTVLMILILARIVFAQEIPFLKQGDKQLHFAVTLVLLSPISYAAMYKFTDGNKFKSALYSTILVSMAAGGYELIHDKAFDQGHTSKGDFFAAMGGHGIFVLSATIIIPDKKKRRRNKRNKF